jgi:hypothetical protein
VKFAVMLLHCTIRNNLSMSHVFLSKQAVQDLKTIFQGLISWSKGALELPHALRYVNEIENACYALGNKPIHLRSRFLVHQHFGTYVFRFRRNRQTTWYIVYDIAPNGTILVNKILSNHTTTGNK